MPLGYQTTRRATVFPSKKSDPEVLNRFFYDWLIRNSYDPQQLTVEEEEEAQQAPAAVSVALRWSSSLPQQAPEDASQQAPTSCLSAYTVML